MATRRRWRKCPSTTRIIGAATIIGLFLFREHYARTRVVLSIQRAIGNQRRARGDNSIALCTALYRLHFLVNAEGVNVLPTTAQIPNAPDAAGLNEDKLAGNSTARFGLGGFTYR
jgi:hypothetical protein